MTQGDGPLVLAGKPAWGLSRVPADKSACVSVRVPAGEPACGLSRVPADKSAWGLSRVPADKSACVFDGYAALFGVRDRGGDVIVAGAFAGLSAPLPLLWQHDPARRIGVIDAVAEDARGLRVRGRINGSGATAQAAVAMLCAGDVSGLLFGYRVRSARGQVPVRGLPTRLLTALDVVEVSVVTHPMQPGARVGFISRSRP